MRQGRQNENEIQRDVLTIQSDLKLLSFILIQRAQKFALLYCFFSANLTTFQKLHIYALNGFHFLIIIICWNKICFLSFAHNLCLITNSTIYNFSKEWMKYISLLCFFANFSINAVHRTLFTIFFSRSIA